MDYPLNVSQHIHPIDWQHLLNLIINLLGMFFRISINSSSKSVKITAHLRTLCLVPFIGPTGNAHRSHILVRVQIFFSEILSRLSSCLAIQSQNQITMTLHLRPAKSLEKSLSVFPIDMGHTPAIPEDFCTF